MGAQPLIIMTVPGNPPMSLPTIGLSPFMMSSRNAPHRPKAMAIATAAIRAVFLPNLLSSLNCQNPCEEEIAKSKAPELDEVFLYH